MMILCQNREVIEQVGKRIYILQMGEQYQVMNKAKDDVVILGEYKKHCNAEQVLEDIFQAIRCQKESYCMPEINSPTLV